MMCTYLALSPCALTLPVSPSAARLAVSRRYRRGGNRIGARATQEATGRRIILRPTISVDGGEDSLYMDKLSTLCDHARLYSFDTSTFRVGQVWYQRGMILTRSSSQLRGLMDRCHDPIRFASRQLMHHSCLRTELQYNAGLHLSAQVVSVQHARSND